MFKMRVTVMTTVALGAGALGVNASVALPVSGLAPAIQSVDVVQARWVCNEAGRCYNRRASRKYRRYYSEEPGYYRYGPSYGYAPSYGYYGPGYAYYGSMYGDGPGYGYGYGYGPGVSIGFRW